MMPAELTSITRLTGRTILIAPSDSEGRALLLTELGAFGARVIVCPTVEIGPPESYQSLDEAIENLYGYDWLIFSNANGVDYFLRRFRQLGREIGDLDALRVYAIGEATARTLEDSHAHVDLVAEQFKTVEIFAALATYAGGPENLGRLNFLIPRAAIARDHLSQMLEDSGARVDVVVAYRTAGPLHTELTNLNALLAGGGIDCIAFTSVASVQNFAQLFDANDLSGLLKGVAVACIDDITAKAAADCGLETAIMPIESTLPALARAIAAHFSR
jgi:uroporphyrinogen III methyltransferase/synthase